MNSEVGVQQSATAVTTVRVLVSHGGTFQRSNGGFWQYVGGETRMVCAPVMPDCALLRKVIANALECPWPEEIHMKFTLPSMEGMLVDVVDDVDVNNMWEEWHDLKATTRPTPKLHLYVQLPSLQGATGGAGRLAAGAHEAHAGLMSSPARPPIGLAAAISLPVMHPFTPPRTHHHHHHSIPVSLPQTVSEDLEYMVSHPNPNALFSPVSNFNTNFHPSTGVHYNFSPAPNNNPNPNYSPSANYNLNAAYNPNPNLNPNFNPVANCMRLLGANIPPVATKSMAAPTSLPATASPSRPMYSPASSFMAAAGLSNSPARPPLVNNVDKPGQPLPVGSHLGRGPMTRDDTWLASLETTFGQRQAVLAGGGHIRAQGIVRQTGSIHKPFGRGAHRRISWDVSQDVVTQHLDLFPPQLVLPHPGKDDTSSSKRSEECTLERFASLDSSCSIASNQSGTNPEASVKVHLDIIPSRHLQVEWLLGQGPSGEVYLGRWHSTPVAIKVIRAEKYCPGGNADSWVTSGALANLVEECNRLAGVRHPNLITLYGLVMPAQARVQDQVLLPTPVPPEEQDTSDMIHIHPDAAGSEVPTSSLHGPAVVYEYMNGRSILSSFSRGYPLLKAKLAKVQVALGAARGLHYLHLKGIIHGDLKTGNVLVGSQDLRLITKIADAGMSRRRLSHSGMQACSAHIPCLAWLSPERVSAPGLVTGASDVYAFGMLLWSLWTEAEPWEGVPQEELLQRMQSFWEGLRPPVPGQPEWNEDPIDEPCPGWRGLMMRCWAQVPGHRPPFAQVVEELESMLHLQQQQEQQQKKVAV